MSNNPSVPTAILLTLLKATPMYKVIKEAKEIQQKTPKKV